VGTSAHIMYFKMAKKKSQHQVWEHSKAPNSVTGSDGDRTLSGTLGPAGGKEAKWGRRGGGSHRGLRAQEE
jgi:hypothetical protein